MDVKRQKYTKNRHTIEVSIVQLPNNVTIQATQSRELTLHKNLSAKAKRVFILPKPKSANMISIGQLCDDDNNVVFNKRHSIAI